MNFTPHTLAIHHSASPLTTTAEEIRSWHKARGWRDIGYAWVMEQGGTIEMGRGPFEMGAHVKGHNIESIGLCIVGDNTKQADRWTTGQRESLFEFLPWVERVLGIHVFKGHKEFPGAHTACPGLSVQELLRSRRLPWEP